MIPIIISFKATAAREKFEDNPTLDNFKQFAKKLKAEASQHRSTSKYNPDYVAGTNPQKLPSDEEFEDNEATMEEQHKINIQRILADKKNSKRLKELEKIKKGEKENPLEKETKAPPMEENLEGDDAEDIEDDIDIEDEENPEGEMSEGEDGEDDIDAESAEIDDEF